MAVNSPNLMKDMTTHSGKSVNAYKDKCKEICTENMTSQSVGTRGPREYSENSEREAACHTQGRALESEILEVRRTWGDIIKMGKEKNGPPRIGCP